MKTTSKLRILILALAAHINTANATGFVAGQSPQSGLFADGSDGNVTLDGVTSYVSFASLSGSTYTLTRTIYPANLTLNAGVTIVTAGQAIFVQKTFVWNGTISADGNAASGSTGGAAIGAADGTTYFFFSGATTQNGIATALSSQVGISQGANYYGGATGGGGKTDGTTQLAGTNVTATQAFTSSAKRGLFLVRDGFQGGSSSNNYFACGPSQAVLTGRGSGDGTNAGGGIGGPAGCVLVWAKDIIAGSAASAHANGGAGGTPTTGTTGGGGGGGGGAIFIYARSYSGTALVSGGNVLSNGGAAGSGHGGGGPGSDGLGGRIYIVTLQ